MRRRADGGQSTGAPYGYEARSYALALLLMSLLLVAAQHYVAKPGWRSYVASSSALLYTNYFAAINMVGVSLTGALILYLRRDKPSARPWSPSLAWIAAQALTPY